MGLGAEILLALMLGFVVLGPKRLHAMLGDVARAKAKFEEASRGFKSQLTAELEATSRNGENDVLTIPLAADNGVQPDHSDSLGATKK